MTNNRTSPIWKLPKKEFSLLCKNHNSLASILRSFNFQAGAGNYKTLKRRIEAEKIDISHIRLGLNNNKGRSGVRKYTTQDLAIEAINSGKIKDNTSVRKLIIRFNLLPYNECSICSLKKEWNGKLLTFQMDHIDGNSKHHHLKNIRFLCPNCHTQTETFSGKKTRKMVSVGGVEPTMSSQ